MKIYLLDIDKSMTDEWEKVFKECKEIEIVNDNFQHFMDTHKYIDGIVSPAHSFGIMDGGYDKAIIDYLGKMAQTNVLTILDILFNGYQPIGSCCPITFYKYTILHTPTMRCPEEIIDKRVIFDCMFSCLNTAERSKLKYIVIPAFGACTGKVPKDMVAKLMHFAYIVYINKDKYITDNWNDIYEIHKTLNIFNNTENTTIANLNNLDNYITKIDTVTENAHGLTYACSDDCIDSIYSIENHSTSKAINTLQSLDEYIENNEHIQKQSFGMLVDFSEPKYKCPKCSGNVRKNLTMVCTSYPPKYRYECDKCDYVDFHSF